MKEMASLSIMANGVRSPCLPMGSISAPKGETGSYSKPSSIQFKTTHPTGLSLRAQPSNGRRFTTHAERGLLGSRIKFDPLRSTKLISGTNQMKSARAVCAFAASAVAESQTASWRLTNNTVPGKEKMPILDDGGGFGGNDDGFKSYYRGDDSGAGGGAGRGGSPSAGGFPWEDFGFCFFGLLLRFLFMQIIGEGYFSFKQSDGRNKPIQHYL